MEGPRVDLGSRHRREPHEPIEPVVVGRDHARTTHRIAGLALELVRPPVRVVTGHGIVGALDDDLVPLAPDTAERTVGIDQIQSVK
jgi:hypothetical protein